MEQARQFVTTSATAHADVPGEWLQITVARAGHGSAERRSLADGGLRSCGAESGQRSGHCGTCGDASRS
jgi:hypothetical protein